MQGMLKVHEITADGKPLKPSHNPIDVKLTWGVINNVERYCILRCHGYTQERVFELVDMIKILV